VWADTAYRSKQNEAHLSGNGFVSRIHRKKPPGKPMPWNVARVYSEVEGSRRRRVRVRPPEGANGARGAHHRLGVGHGEDRAANLVYNMNRAVWLDRSRARMA
jgi:hypothetical protein